jgi:hypothetical protein
MMFVGCRRYDTCFLKWYSESKSVLLFDIYTIKEITLWEGCLPEDLV